MTENNRGPLQREDYVEPACVLCGDPYGARPKPRTIPQQRVIEKMDEYMSRRDYAGAERHLLYWLAEAKDGRDQRGELLVRNELIGHYRKTGEREKAFESIDEALRLLRELDFDGTVSSGTTYTNAATAMNAFGENGRALELFEKARAAYEAAERTAPELLGGLYNNMALTCVSLGKYGEASGLYDKALAAMERVPGGCLERAITYLNMADAAAAESGAAEAEDRIYDLLDRAEALLDEGQKLTDSGVVEDGYYAFVCEKCAPVFDHYGYFRTAERLKARSEEIYRKNQEDGTT